MKIRKRIKRTTKQYIIVAIICIIVIGGAAIFTSVIITGQIRSDYQTMLSQANKKLKDNQKNVYVATSDIMAGEFITADNVKLKLVYSSQPEKLYITEKEIGKVALVNIPSGVQVIKNMLTKDKVSSELRELEYSVINLNSNVVSNDTVDVRICYPNGESYVVLSKKVIKGVDTETSICFLWLEEEEILRMSAAIVDAGLYPGAKLYVTKYIEPSIQEASIVNYTPSLSILSMIEQDPNIVDRYSQELSKEVRKALENRLASSMETDVSSISWEVSSENQFLSSPSPTPVPPIASEDEPAPTSEPEIAKNPAASGTSGELGSTQDYLYYAQEKEAKDGVVEYGE